MASVDILSDDEDDMLCAPPAPAPSAQTESVAAAPAAAPAPAAPEGGGLRSVVVASLDLVDSDEEQQAPPAPPAAPAASSGAADLLTKASPVPAAAAVIPAGQDQNSISVSAEGPGTTMPIDPPKQQLQTAAPVTKTAAEGKSVQIEEAVPKVPPATTQAPRNASNPSTTGKQDPCAAPAAASTSAVLSDDDDEDDLLTAASVSAPTAGKPPCPAAAAEVKTAADQSSAKDTSKSGAVAKVPMDSSQAGLNAEKKPAVPGPAVPESDDEEDNLLMAAPPGLPAPAADSGKSEGSALVQASASTGKKAPCQSSSNKRSAPAAADSEDAPAAKQPRQAPEVAPASASGPPKKAGGGAAKPDTKDKKLSKSEMETKVLDYMRQQNRPYNAQNVFDNLKGVVPKNTVQALLDQFAGSGHVLLKEYGKIKVYLASQTAAATEQGQDASLQADVDQAQSELKVIKTQCDELRKSVAQTRSKQAVRVEAKAVEEEAESLDKHASEKRASANNGSAQVEEVATAEEVASAEKTYGLAHTEWRKRKRLCTELLKTLGEAMNVGLNKLVDKYGVDTDEDCGELMPNA